MSKSYFTIEELCYSDTAEREHIDNTPSEEIKKRLQILIEFLNPLREAWGSGIRINSGYRCPELNKAVGGVDTSAHKEGWACDMYPVNNKFEEFKQFIIEYLKDKNFDQCIQERSGSSQWIHLGLWSKGRQRKQIFKIEK